MRQVPRSPRRASVCRSGSGSRLVRNARNCHLEDLAPASRQWARRTLHIVMLAIAFHFQVAPGQPFRCAPVAIPYEPLDGLSREALTPPGCQRLVGMCAGTVLLSCKRMMALLIRQSARSQRKGRSCLTTESSVRAPTPHRRILVVKTKSRALPPRPKPVGDANSARPMFDFTASNRRRSASGFDDNDGGQRRRASG